jgi:gamma-glutamyltranspeptidase/glutathione hydrolase
MSTWFATDGAVAAANHLAASAGAGVMQRGGNAVDAAIAAAAVMAVVAPES